MNRKINVDDDLLTFIGDVSLGGLGNAAGAYAKLIQALTGKEPSWQDFTAFLLREGYVVKKEPKV